MAASKPVFKDKKDVIFGFYVTALYDLDEANNTFGADINMWSVSDKGFEPPRASELTNVKTLDQSQETTILRKTPRGTKVWTQSKVRGIFRHSWDVRNFPFDRHVIQIQVEKKLDDKNFNYEIDKTESGIAPHLEVDGWVMENFRILSEESTYDTNFGDPSLTGNAKIMRFTVEMDIVRSGTTPFWKMHMGVYVAFAIAMLSFFMQPLHATVFSGRMGLLAGTLFAVVINLRAAEASLGHFNVLTLCDKIHILSMVFIFGAALVAIFSRRAIECHDEAASRRLDRKMLVAFSWNYVFVNIVLIVLAALDG